MTMLFVRKYYTMFNKILYPISKIIVFLEYFVAYIDFVIKLN